LFAICDKMGESRRDSPICDEYYKSFTVPPFYAALGSPAHAFAKVLCTLAARTSEFPPSDKGTPVARPVRKATDLGAPLLDATEVAGLSKRNPSGRLPEPSGSLGETTHALAQSSTSR
jgi:hypothetical protein